MCFYLVLSIDINNSNIKLRLPIVLQGSIDVEELKGIKSPPYVLEHVELTLRPTHLSLFTPPILDAVLWCCRPQSLTLNLSKYDDKCHVIQVTFICVYCDKMFNIFLFDVL